MSNYQSHIDEWREIIKNKYLIPHHNCNLIIKFIELTERHKKSDNFKSLVNYKLIDIREIQHLICIDLFDSNMLEQYLELYFEKIARTRSANFKLDIDSRNLFIPLENAPCFYCNSNNLAKLRDFEDAEIHIRNYIIYDGKFPDCDAVAI